MGACSIIGGVVYRGTRFPDWRGVYIFGELCSGTVWALRDILSPERQIRKLLSADIGPTAIGAGQNGDVILTDVLGGALYRLELPADFDVGWQSVAELHDEGVTAARRSADVSLIGFLDSRMRRRESLHIGIHELPNMQRLLGWHDALGRPSLRRMLAFAGVTGALGLVALIACIWIGFRLISLSRQRRSGGGE